MCTFELQFCFGPFVNWPKRNIKNRMKELNRAFHFGGYGDNNGTAGQPNDENEIRKKEISIFFYFPHQIFRNNFVFFLYIYFYFLLLNVP